MHGLLAKVQGKTIQKTPLVPRFEAIAKSLVKNLSDPLRDHLLWYVEVCSGPRNT